MKERKAETPPPIPGVPYPPVCATPCQGASGHQLHSNCHHPRKRLCGDRAVVSVCWLRL